MAVLFEGNNWPKYPFSAAIRAAEYIFVSGQGGFQDTKTGEAIEGIESQTRQCLENMKQVLEAARSTAVTALAIPNMLVEIECIAYCPSR